MPRQAQQAAKHPVLKQLGANVRDLRQKRELSQEELADAAHIERSYVSGIERGVRNCTVMKLVKLARALRVPVRDLFND